MERALHIEIIMELKKYSEKEIDKFFEDNAIEMDSLSDFLSKIMNLNIALDFDAPFLTIKVELEDA